MAIKFVVVFTSMIIYTILYAPHQTTNTSRLTIAPHSPSRPSKPKPPLLSLLLLLSLRARYLLLSNLCCRLRAAPWILDIIPRHVEEQWLHRYRLQFRRVGYQVAQIDLTAGWIVLQCLHQWQRWWQLGDSAADRGYLDECAVALELGV